jgi:hypothetical protein
MAHLSSPGPQCRFRFSLGIDDGTLCRQASPIPGPVGCHSLWPELYEPGFLPAALGMAEAITDADKAEFAIIKKMHVLDHSRRPYANVGSYVSDRTLYFGSPALYAAYAAESDAELSSTKWVSKKHTRSLRSMLEFSHNLHQQQIFYRWVRKAYQRKNGNDVNVPELIRRGMSQELANKIIAVRGSIRVKKIHDEEFKAGGFNPRPVKYAHSYLLGTLSEHGTGMAVDIDDTQNAQLTLDEWKFIETLTGKYVVRSGRWGTEDGAGSLWKDIKEVNDLFVKKVAAEVLRIEKERTEKAKAESEKQKTAAGVAAVPVAKPKKQLSPLEEILAINYKSLSPYVKTGFFHLPLELVLELHAHGFTWGAGFGTNVDLHHFELD